MRREFHEAVLPASIAACGAYLSAKNHLSATAPAESCDRACLERFADKYLAALVSHKYSQLPLAPNARYTENGQGLRMDDGMWQVATAIVIEVPYGMPSGWGKRNY